MKTTEIKITGVSSTYSDSVSFGLPTNWWELDLNRDADRITSVSGISHVKSGFKWNNGDMLTTDWFPQGITGLQTTDSNNKVYKFMVVSWYNKTGAKGVRLSFVDTVDPRKYRHVLLVMPDANNNIKPLTEIQNSDQSQHAGGIEIIGSKLYVADTSFGIREFDLGKIYESSNVPLFDAFDYKYIMPQQKSYNVSSFIMDGAGNVPKFSYLSRIWTDGLPQLLSGNFNIDDDSTFDNQPSRICRWEIDQANGTITQSGYIIQLNCQRVQGAVLRLKGNTETLYLSRSYGKKQYKLYVVEIPDNPEEYVTDNKLGGFTKYDWCNYSEDMHLSKSDNLWCQKEKSGKKVFYVDPDVYHVSLSEKIG